MAYHKFTGTYHSSDHRNQIHYYIYEPENGLRAIVQLVHDFGDSIENNAPLIDFFTEHGIMVCGCDLVGHGKSAQEGGRGYFGERDGWVTLVKDTKKLTRYMKREYYDIPYFIYGHGMGSLIARMDGLYDSGISGMILSGTSGKQKYCRRLLLLTALLKRLRGGEQESAFLNACLLRHLNRRFQSERDSFSFLAEDGMARERGRRRQGSCPLTVAACEDLLKLLFLTSTKKWYRSFSREIPVLLVSGVRDPIGNFGKGTQEVRRKLEATSHQAKSRLFDGMRHNIQEEPGREEVFRAMLSFVKCHIAE